MDKYWLIIAIIMITFISGCGPDQSESREAQLEPTQEIVIQENETESAQVFQTQVPTKTSLPIPTQSTPDSSEGIEAIGTEQVEPSEETQIYYQVNFVEPDDTLNVRAGAGISYDVLAELQPGTDKITVTGPGIDVDGDLWVPIERVDVVGWVNSNYLIEIVSSPGICDDAQVQGIINDLILAIEERDGEGIAELVADGRGFRIRRNWWNPEVWISESELMTIFEDQEPLKWGIADGSGLPIEGSFQKVILPLLDRNLLNANSKACNELLHAGTAGFVILPPAYEGINFISYHRAPGPEDNELDWGTWVIGIERWQGSYYLSFLVHYEWEI